MCGLAGRYAHGDLSDSAVGLATGLQTSLRRRGPDGTGVHVDRDVVLVHRRLAILDLSSTGDQPLWNEDQTVCVLVNGEIYNFEAIRESLQRKGHRFRGRSDSEVIVHLYEEGGIDGCCDAIKGMFAFALWDSRSRDLYLVRDRLGIKPLVVAEHKDGVTFGSSVRALLADPAVPREWRDEAFVALLRWGFVPTPWSALRAARRVHPGTWLRIRGGQVAEEKRYWTDSPTPQGIAEPQVRAAILRAVRSHMIADVPVGSLLSAGVDSSLVTLLAAKSVEGPGIEAWTVSHRGCPENEFDDAAALARQANVAIHEVPLGTAGLTASRFEHIVDAMDEPLPISSLVGLYALYEEIAPHQKVVLSGDGGDELFAGYDWHGGMPRRPVWAETSVFRALTPALAGLDRRTGRLGSLGRLAAQMRRHDASVYLDKLRVATDDELMRLGLDPEIDDPLEATAIAAWERFSDAPQIERMLAVDRATALVDEMLAKVDVASMAHSVEARVPLLADDVVAAAKGLAPSEKRIGDTGKQILRRWLDELSPTAAAFRPKTGFNSPLAAWLAGEAKDVIHDFASAGAAAVNAKLAGQLTARSHFAFAVAGAWLESASGMPLARV